MNKEKIKIFRQTVNKHLPLLQELISKDLGENVGLSLGRGSTDDFMISFDLDIMEQGEDGNPKIRQIEEFLKYGKNYGFKKDDLNRVVILGKEAYKIIGLKRNNPKNPVLLEKVSPVSDYTYKFSADKIVRAIKNGK